ncbi:Tetratricopeptide-like helical domain superfamily [Arabidopsis thaliana x Arabidopsis arenosa]|uniref:Tetratricopeptide-like helical domain superfamily n=1 Tax=Arabidopsis thaliana x Arabidopsis arenosa TaxID=1240361 RepID=A0A8T2ETR0_9BRAS|nr:Tetratricopeptide-like helical domain superfamily [Arabidopsis thaliana x Arabidopsis arenosa]
MGRSFTRVISVSKRYRFTENDSRYAISKLEDAILIDPMKHDAVWCLGNAYTSYARLTPDDTQARLNFGLAYLFFGIAVAQQPDNQVYHKSLEMADKAPQLHTGVHKNRLLSLLGGVETLALPSPKVVKNKKSSDEKYIVMGWVILAIGVVACISFRKLR